MFEQAYTADILKWVALVFLAGFIGFFGKYLGRVVLSLFQKMPRQEPDRSPGGPDGGPAAQIQALRDEEKLRKKASKNAVKERKKLGK
ncbi:MAG TPA: hypothetical protein PLU54_00740 [Deltaproteobacteria bacterium]|nr:hypothetical protein [Deltaproteobacteria bacterium]